MNNQEAENILLECKNDLDSARNILLSLGATSTVVPFLNKYCIIRACGSIEIAFKMIISDKLNLESKSQIKKYINKHIRESSMNPSYDNICSLLKKFDDSWNSNFKNRIKDHPQKTNLMFSLESLIAARNEFAHGGNPNLSLRNTIDYFENSKVIIQILDNVMKD